tara:strand:+ start:55 stop:210 length:156 start_codon:yes stop_codon:yes gene_type:complete
MGELEETLAMIGGLETDLTATRPVRGVNWDTRSDGTTYIKPSERGMCIANS